MKRSYIIIFYESQPPTSTEQQEIEQGISMQTGANVKLLNCIKTSPLPTSPDDYVIATCLLNCKKNNLPFDSDRDQIAYRSAMGLGVATILLST